MTSTTMIWQTLNMVVAGMVRNKKVPETKELFEEMCIKNTQSIIAFSDEEIKSVLYNYDVTVFADVIRNLYNK